MRDSMVLIACRFRRRKEGLHKGLMLAVDDEFVPFVYVGLLVTMLIVATVYSFISPGSEVGVKKKF
jgi:hypothetical protein